MPTLLIPSIRSRCSLAVLFVSTFALFGCSGGGGGPKDVVKGKVTLNGQPVSGQVVFIGPDKKEITALITLSGEYSIPSPPKGEYVILVKGMGVTPPTGSKGGDKMKNDPTKDVSSPAGGQAPPEKYSQPNNGLKFTVTGGEQTNNIELTP
jgi:hypothetical protein